MLTEAQAAEIIQLSDAAVTNAIVSDFASQEAEEDAELALIATVGGLISHDKKDTQ